MFLQTTNCYQWRQVSISERSKVTNNCNRVVKTGNVEVANALVAMLLVLQIPFRLLLAQSHSLCKFVIDNFMFSETTFNFMFTGFMSYGT